LADKEETITLAQYQKAYRDKRLREAKLGFKANLAAYVIVNAVLITINMLAVPDFPWFLFPLVGWGIGITMHYNFGVRNVERALDEEQAEIEKLATEAAAR
jgi:hypothetical protein